jgi:phosphate transport system protein
MDRHLDDELQKLKQNILKMASLTELAIHDSFEALKGVNKNLAEAVISRDEQIDDLEIDNEEHAIEVLALFQPMAKDLRFVVTAMHINAELELIADLTVNICQRVLELSEKGGKLLEPINDLPQLAENAKWMVKNAIDAFVNNDEPLAEKVILSDGESNQLRSAIIQRLVDGFIVKDGKTAPRAIPLLLVARDLERICDRATYIAEEVIYMIQARVIKHHREDLGHEPPTNIV